MSTPDKPTDDPLLRESIVTPPAGTANLSLEQAMTLAANAHQAGELQQAEHVLRQVLQAMPDCAPALHLLGVIAHQVGKLELAIELTGKAVAAAPQVALFNANLGEMCRLAGRLEEAQRYGEAAVRADPALAMAHSNLGIACYEAGDAARAEQCQMRALELEPDLSPALNNLGSIHRDREALDEAIDYYRRAAAADPNNVEPLNNLGATLITNDEPEEALNVLQLALDKQPNYAHALCNAAFALNKTEQMAAAENLFNRALELKPDYGEAYVGLTYVYLETDAIDKALQASDRALQLMPEDSDALNARAAALAHLGHSAEAKALYERALKVKPDSGASLNGLGLLEMQLGDMHAAETHFRRTLASGKDEFDAWFHLSRVGKVTRDSDVMAALLEQAARIDELPPRKTRPLHFALGKACDDIGDYDRAMTHYIAGCRLKRADIEYNEQRELGLFRRLAEVFDEAYIDRLRGHGDPSAKPIFVLGQPRSGTTLTEQIIASHPRVFGAGELRDLFVVLGRTFATSPAASEFPQTYLGLEGGSLGELARDYLARITPLAPAADRITDKMPGNFLMIGLIHLMLPNARIIHVMRNPIDTCVSGFTQMFQHNQHQTYDLAEIGRYYRAYHELMAHWRRVLPPGSFLDLSYEALVADIDTEARNLIAYCELDWDPACLAFYDTRRDVRTASIAQVRQPVYRSSVERWRRYERHLGPLIDALGDLAQTD